MAGSISRVLGMVCVLGGVAIWRRPGGSEGPCGEGHTDSGILGIDRRGSCGSVSDVWDSDARRVGGGGYGAGRGLVG